MWISCDMNQKKKALEISTALTLREKFITEQEVCWRRIIEATLISSCVLTKTCIICLHSLFQFIKKILQRKQRKCVKIGASACVQ